VSWDSSWESRTETTTPHRACRVKTRHARPHPSLGTRDLVRSESPAHVAEYGTTCGVCLTLPVPGHNTHDGNPILGVYMRNFPNGCLMTSGYAPPGVSAIGHGLRRVGPYGRDPGRSHMTAARCVLAGTATAALTGAAAGVPTARSAVLSEAVTAVLTGAAAGALSGRATTTLTGAAAMPAGPRARGPPRPVASSPGSARRDLPKARESRRLPRQNRRAGGCIHRPDLPREPFRCTEREDVESQYFTSETHSLVASRSRSRWRRWAEPDP